MTDEKHIRLAIAAHLGTAGAQQPASALTTVEEHNGRRYVVLRNVAGVLGVYRIYPDGSLGALRRWPKGIAA